MDLACPLISGLDGIEQVLRKAYDHLTTVRFPLLILLPKRNIYIVSFFICDLFFLVTDWLVVCKKQDGHLLEMGRNLAPLNRRLSVAAVHGVADSSKLTSPLI
jgi:hypothetical protein